jgi:hypothetical protein
MALVDATCLQPFQPLRTRLGCLLFPPLLSASFRVFCGHPSPNPFPGHAWFDLILRASKSANSCVASGEG